MVKEMNIHNQDSYKEKILSLGSSANPENQHCSEEDVLMRTIMRHPDRDLEPQLDELHSRIGDLLEDQSDEALLWLLGGGSPNPRGGFQNDVLALKKFLAKNPSEIGSSRLISGLETLITNISYRAIKAQNSSQPLEPETDDQKKLFDSLCLPAKEWILKQSDINRIYLDRKFSQSHQGDVSGILPEIREDLSEGSDIDLDDFQESLQKPSNFLGKTFPSFMRYKNTFISTWAHSAQQSNIPIRLLVSSSASICAGTVCWLLSESKELSNSENINSLCALLFIPTYYRAHYHTIAETAAGIYHYTVCKGNNQTFYLPLSPQESLSFALRMLIRVVDRDLRSDVEKLCVDIFKKTKTIRPYLANVGLDVFC